MADDRYNIPVPAAGASGILDPLAPAVGYFFSGPQGTPSYPELERRRQLMLARAAAAKRGFPTTLGQGITSLGEAIGERIEGNQLSAQERELDAAETKRLNAGTSRPGPGGQGLPPTGRPNSAELIDPAANATRDRITALTLGGGQENPTSPGVDTPPVTAVGGLSPEILANRSGIAGIETGGGRSPYTMMGAITPKGDRAYGKYQVMGANIPEWSQAALGRTLTPQQFLADDKAQDAIFDHRFGNYVNQYGQEGAARAWYGGERGMNNLGKTDQHGRLNVLGYGRQYLRNRGGAQPSGDPGEAGDDRGSTMTIDSATGASPEDNPPTPTTIKPAPAMVGGTGSRVVNNTPPSLTEVPPQTEEIMEPPGPKPLPPKRVDFSERQLEMLKIMQHRGSSPYAKEVAKQYFDMDEKVRGELTTQRMEEYRNDREAWEKQDLDYKKHVREAPTRRISMLKERLGIETNQAALEKTRIELAKLYHMRDGGEWDIALQKAQSDLDEQRQKVQAGHAPQVTKVGDQEMIWDQKLGKFVPIPQPPTQVDETGRPTGKLSAEQDKLLDHHGKASLALDQFNRVPDADNILAQGLRDEIAGKLPFVGNAALSSRYRTVRNAANNFLVAHLRRTSGAVIGPEEMLQHHRDLIPIWGDDAATVKNKREMRANIVEGMYTSLGTARPHADYVTKKRQQSDAEEQAKMTEEMKGVGTPVIGRVYKDGNKRRYWTGTRWEED
jgi:hypothetical protein